MLFQGQVQLKIGERDISNRFVLIKRWTCEEGVASNEKYRTLNLRKCLRKQNCRPENN